MLSEIVRLSDHELDLLLDALALGTIQPGSSAGVQQIRRAGLGSQADRLLHWLPEASRRFATVEAIIAAIRLVRDERRRASETAPRPELILTGPEVADMTSRDTRVVVRELFESARRSVLIVGYAFHGSDRIFEPLANRMAGDPELAVTIVVNVHPKRGRSPEQTVREFSAEFLRSSWPFHPKPAIYYSPGSLENQGSGLASVHAKLIVLDECRVYLGSANFTTAAFQRNVEASIRLRSAELGRQLTGYFHQMIHEGHLCPLPID